MKILFVVKVIDDIEDKSSINKNLKGK